MVAQDLAIVPRVRDEKDGPMRAQVAGLCRGVSLDHLDVSQVCLSLDEDLASGNRNHRVGAAKIAGNRDRDFGSKGDVRGQSPTQTVDEREMAPVAQRVAIWME